MEIDDKIKSALEYTKENEFDKAAKIYLNILKDDPENGIVLSFIGLLYYNQKKYKKSENYFVKAYKIPACRKIVASYLGIVKYIFLEYENATKYLEEGLASDTSIKVYRALLSSCLNVKDYSKAYQHAITAHKIYPLDEEILKYLATASINYGRFEEGELYSRRLLQLNPKSAKAWYNLGLLEELITQDHKKAREYFKEIVKCGDKQFGYTNLYLSYNKESKNKKKAAYYFNKLKKMNNGVLQDNFTQANYYLTKKQFKKGYLYYINPTFYSKDDYDWRTKFKNRWVGGEYPNETILIFGDQGIGDQIMFSRYLKFMNKYFKNIKVMVHKSLIKIMRENFENIKFYPAKKNLPHYSKSVMMSALIYFLGKNFGNIPDKKGYLKPTQLKISHYKTTYFNNDKLKVGICWEAGATNLRDMIHRSLKVEFFEDIINKEYLECYSLQVNPTNDTHKQYSNLIDIGQTFNDFNDTAAALKNLDYFITVDTSIAHMAGALGVKTLLLLPHSSDWRWFENTETTEWYDSLKIFRQKDCTNWKEVFDRLSEFLDDSILTSTH